MVVRIRYKSNVYRFLRGLGYGDEGIIYMSLFSMEIWIKGNIEYILLGYFFIMISYMFFIISS